MILLTEHINNDGRIHPGTMPVTVKRNGTADRWEDSQTQAMWGTSSGSP